MRKLDNGRSIDIDNGKETGTCGSHSVCWVLLAPILQECGSCVCVEIECEELSELLDAKWARNCCDTLEEAVGVFPVLLSNFFQRAIVCLVERVWQFIESATDALSETVSEVLKLAGHPFEPISQV